MGNGGAAIARGLAAGALGGLAGAWAMTQFQNLWSKVSGDQGGGGGGDPATVKAAESVSEAAFDRELTADEKSPAGQAVHYAMGAFSGAVYGVAAEVAPTVTVGAGVPFGTAVWLIADDLAVPALGLSKSPLEYPASMHAYSLASHFVYGLVTDVVRRSVRQALA